ncbi:hypothetical protein WAI453_012124 [Rhynchosporium graminicola]
MQLKQLEQGSKERLVVARQDADLLGEQDYQLQLMLLEKQEKNHHMLVQQEEGGIVSDTTAEIEEKPIYITYKQFHRILKRRSARVQYEGRAEVDVLGPLISVSQNKRGTEACERENKLESNTSTVVLGRGQGGGHSPKDSTPVNSGSFQIRTPRPDAIESANHDLRASAATAVVPDINFSRLVSTPPYCYEIQQDQTQGEDKIFQHWDALERELGLLPSQYASDEDICKRIVDHERHRAYPDDSLQSATLGWSCVCVFLKIHKQALNPTISFSSSTLSIIFSTFLQLQEIVQIIARYAVKENLYQQSLTSGTDTALSL